MKNMLIEDGKVNFLIDGQWGSTGKGKLAGYLYTKYKNITIAITFAVALYCLFLIGIIASNVISMKEDIKDIRQNVNYFDKVNQ